MKKGDIVLPFLFVIDEIILLIAIEMTLREIVEAHGKLTNNYNVKVRRDYNRNLVILDWFGGPVMAFDYDFNLK